MTATTLDAVLAERDAHLDHAHELLLAASRSLVSARSTYGYDGFLDGEVYDELANLVSHVIDQLELDEPDLGTIIKALKPLRKADEIRRGFRAG